MARKSSFLLASDLSLVVLDFSVLQMLTLISWGVDSVSRMLTSYSSALNVSDQFSHKLSR